MLAEKHHLEAREVGEMEENASSSPALVTDLASDENPLRTALDNFALAREAKLVRDQRARFEKISRSRKGAEGND